MPIFIKGNPVIKMSTNAEVETSQKVSALGNVKTFPDIKELVNQFYNILPGQLVGAVRNNLKTLSPEAIEKFKKEIDKAQDIFEEFEATRLATSNNFTEEELAKLGLKKLQMIAKSFRMSAKMSEKTLIKNLTGKPKSIPVTQTKYWKTSDNKSTLVQRLREAREVVGYFHPRQLAASEQAAMKSILG